MKTGKKLKMVTFKNYSIVYGSMSKYSKSVYLTLNSWAEPKNEESNYNRVIKDLNKKVKQSIYDLLQKNNISNVLSNQTIVDLDIRVSGVRVNKRSFTNCDITLFFTNEVTINSDEVSFIINEITSTLVDKVFDSNKHLKFYKKKI